MPERKIFLLDAEDSPWGAFLHEFLEDTSVRFDCFHDSASANGELGRSCYDMGFVNPSLLSLALIQKLRVLQHSRGDFKLFGLSSNTASKDGLVFDEIFPSLPPLMQFQKQLVPHLSVPDVIQVLVIDNEMEIADMVKDFLAERTKPSFNVTHMDNGKKGLDYLARHAPDVIVLDIKMPVKDGREVYREIRTKGLKIPVIIFFDAISGDEMVEVRKYGNPAVVEKGSRHSAMPDMMALIKKMVYFG